MQMKPSLPNMIFGGVENSPKIACLCSHFQHPIQFNTYSSSGVTKPLPNNNFYKPNLFLLFVLYAYVFIPLSLDIKSIVLNVCVLPLSILFLIAIMLASLQFETSNIC